MEETVSGTMDNNATLTRLVAHEGFIAHSRHESFKLYVMNQLLVSKWSACRQGIYPVVLMRNKCFYPSQHNSQ
jgi:hypothetical protein